jgi:hypothetical protein
LAARFSEGPRGAKADLTCERASICGSTSLHSRWGPQCSRYRTRRRKSPSLLLPCSPAGQPRRSNASRGCGWLSFGAPKPATHRRPKPATMWGVLGGRIVLFGSVGKGRDQVVVV